DVPEGQEGVKVGTVIATIAGEDEAAPPPRAKAEAPKTQAAPVKEPAKSEKADPAPAPAPAAKAAEPAKPAAAPPPKGDRVIASAVAGGMAAKKAIDLHGVRGTGPNGRIVRADVEGAPAGAAAAKPAAAPALAEKAQPATAAAPGEIPHEVIKLSAMRRTIA